MKTLLVILGIGVIILRLLIPLPWGLRNSKAQPAVRFNFLLGLVVVVGLILVGFWFAMR